MTYKTHDNIPFTAAFYAAFANSSESFLQLITTWLQHHNGLSEAGWGGIWPYFSNNLYLTLVSPGNPPTNPNARSAIDAFYNASSQVAGVDVSLATTVPYRSYWQFMYENLGNTALGHGLNFSEFRVSGSRAYISSWLLPSNTTAPENAEALAKRFKVRVVIEHRAAHGQPIHRTRRCFQFDTLRDRVGGVLGAELRRRSRRVETGQLQTIVAVAVPDQRAGETAVEQVELDPAFEALNLFRAKRNGRQGHRCGQRTGVRETTREVSGLVGAIDHDFRRDVVADGRFRRDVGLPARLPPCAGLTARLPFGEVAEPPARGLVARLMPFASSFGIFGLMARFARAE